jgi:hypothetical protein
MNSLAPLPSPSPRSNRKRAIVAVEVAGARLQAALDLLRQDEDRDDSAKRVSREVDASVQDALSRSRARAAMRIGTVAIPEKWFTAFVVEILDDWVELAREARESGRSARADYIAQRISQLQTDAEKFVEREKLFASPT